MNYTEDKNVAEKNRQDYIDGLNKLIEAREKEGAATRSKLDILSSQSTHRDNFKKMLGWPLTDYKNELPKEPEAKLLSDEGNYTISRLVFEVLPGVNMSGILIKYNDDSVRPFSIVSHGGLGTPELINGFFKDTSNYNNMGMRIFEKGINTFSPQYLLWNKETYNPQYDRQEIDSRLKRVGSSITAVEIFSTIKIIDYFANKDYVGKIGMAGLSYGGFNTLFTAALDTRIISALSCSFFNERHKVPWHDWTWKNAAFTYSDAEIALLCYPRRLSIRVGTQDDLFNVENAKNEYERLKSLCGNIDMSWLDFKEFEGTHEFVRDNETIDDFAKALF